MDPWEPVDLQSLWICGACGSAESVEPCGSAEPRLHRAQALQSPGSVEPRICGARAILAPTGMAAYHINGNTIHSMILANEHRSLGPIFNILSSFTSMDNSHTLLLQVDIEKGRQKEMQLSKLTDFKQKVCRM